MPFVIPPAQNYQFINIPYLPIVSTFLRITINQHPRFPQCILFQQVPTLTSLFRWTKVSSLENWLSKLSSVPSHSAGHQVLRLLPLKHLVPTSFSAYTLTFIFLTLNPLFLTGLPILSLSLKVAPAVFQRHTSEYIILKSEAIKPPQFWNTKSIKLLLINMTTFLQKSNTVDPQNLPPASLPLQLTLSIPQDCSLLCSQWT